MSLWAKLSRRCAVGAAQTSRVWGARTGAAAVHNETFFRPSHHHYLVQLRKMLATSTSASGRGGGRQAAAAEGGAEGGGEREQQQPPSPEIRELAEKLMGGSERALSRAITLCESGLSSDRAQAASLLQHVLLSMKSTEHRPIFSFGFTGPPGCGKSSLIEGRLAGHVPFSFAVVGRCATRAGEKVAVLAIDPSSERTGGSILGDKTRMELLSQDPNAFVRPTPARGHLGGMARNTADAALLCEAGGYTILIIETVGGGQSDIAVAELVDCVILVLPPAGGDELQGIKKGVVEVADIVLVNKADGDMEQAARRAVVEYKSALHFAVPRSKSWSPSVLSCSARTGKGVETVWAKICEFERVLNTSGELQSRRALQRKKLLWSNIKTEITERLRTDGTLRKIMVDLEEQVMAGKLASRTAAYQVANEFFVKRS